MRSALLLDVVLATVLAPLLPLAPLVAAGLARDPAYLRNYRQTLMQAVRHLRAQAQSRAFSRYLLWPTSAHPAGVTGACSHCGRCCLNGSCLFLAWDGDGRSRCRIYGGRFWRLLACGRYPEHAVDIRLYDCPGFQAVEQAGAPRRPPTGLVRPVVFVARRLAGLPSAPVSAGDSADGPG